MRFRSESIKDESYLLSAVRYIHNNPVKAAEECRWSRANVSTAYN